MTMYRWANYFSM